MTTTDRIFTLLKERGVSQLAFAKAIGVSTGNVSDWKTGRSSPKETAITKIADYFNVSVDNLLGRTEDKKGPPATVSSDEGAGSPLEEQLIGYVRRLTPDQQDFLLAQIKTMQERQ